MTAEKKDRKATLDVLNAKLRSQAAQLTETKENPAGEASPSGEAGRPEAKA